MTAEAFFHLEAEMQTPKKRILCVDDHEDSNRMMKVLLEMWDYEVALADTASEGLRLAQSERFDLYLLETCLPEISGLEMCKQICGVSEHAPIVFISAAAYKNDIQRGLQAGALAYITKTLDFEILKITLKQLFPKALGKGLGKPLKGSRVATTPAHLPMGRRNESGSVRSSTTEMQP
jgi:DNA-binding response OmpR family regulator